MPDLTAALDDIRDRVGVVRKLGPPRPGGALANATAASADDVPRLLAAVDAVLARHVPKTVTVRHLCGKYHRIVPVTRCPDCTTTEHVTCAACDPVCPDDNQWPCEDYRDISCALTGEESSR